MDLNYQNNKNLLALAFQRVNSRTLSRLVRGIEIAENKIKTTDFNILGVSLSNMVDIAQAQNIINREGMKKSGIRYAFNEKNHDTHAPVDKDQALQVLSHLKKQSLRTLNILSNPNGYTPPSHGKRLYGSSGLYGCTSFTPAIP